jgi:hypothetical protein
LVIPVASGELRVDGLQFGLVCVRATGVSVYRGDGAYLRLGDGVAGELETHLQMLRDGYPVAEILEVGKHEASLYYIERALGKDTFGDACADRIASGGSMTDEEFVGFLDVMRRHAQAQLAGDNRPCAPQEFAEFIGVDRAVDNTPELA